MTIKAFGVLDLDWNLEWEWWMAGDADFEHARLLKIHTSAVVSARSVMGFSDFGPLVYLQRTLRLRVGHVSFNSVVTRNTPRPHYFISLLRWTPTSTFDMASEAVAGCI